MNLIIDQGNTNVKAAVFEQNKIKEVLTCASLEDKNFIAFISKYEIKKGIFSSVQKEELAQLLKKYNLFTLSHTTPLPLKIIYKTPKTLGLDRVAAAVGAISLFPNTNVLTIDMGTCITYDFINAAQNYLGGGISPGFEMRFKALANYTGKLPLVQFKKEQLKLIGDTTESSIISGIYNGVRCEINGIIQQYVQQYSDLNVVVTGGDVNRFDLEPKNRIFADEFLVLKGLSEILNYNDKIE